MKKDQIKERYLSAVRDYKLLEKKENRLLIILSVLRLAAFFGGLIAIWFCLTQNIFTGIISIILISVLFTYLLKLYWSHDEKREFFSNLALVNQREIDALSGNLSGFDAGNIYIDPGHDFSNDVDLFGNFSLFQYINRTVTGYGRDILAGWLSDPFSISCGLISRQEVIRELAEKAKWRHEFMAYGMKRPMEKRDIAALLEWMDESASFQSSSLKKVLIYLLPSLTIISLLLLISGILHYSVFTLFVLINMFYITIGLKSTNKIHQTLTRKYIYLSSIDKLLKVFDNELFASGALSDIKMNISGNNISAYVSVSKLGRLIQSFDSRMNMLVGVVLNGLLLWDYHCIYRLEKWKSRYRKLFPVWLEMLGRVDAYISLGNYAHNNPDFAYPLISDKNIVFSAKMLGHQLIPEHKRVCNDFSIEHKGTICIISGANMAGKSTFLRTVAINYILGMAGAPVCASEMSFIPAILFTSMRTTDSLSGNESYFYAELKRLKALKTRIEAGEPVFFILDEILKGTNSTDKSAGSKLFMEKLVVLGGTGLIATHDTSLGMMEEDHPGVIVNRCFETEIDGELIKFDYKLQEGITQKMNAAFLMKQMGIVE